MEKKIISFYDPIKNAYCDMPIERVLKLIKEAKRIEKELEKV